MKNKLENQGYFVIRAAGSHGVADLVAMKYDPITTHHTIWFVSCKMPEYAPPHERLELIETAKRYGAVALLTKRGKGREWVLEEVIL